MGGKGARWGRETGRGQYLFLYVNNVTFRKTIKSKGTFKSRTTSMILVSSWRPYACNNHLSFSSARDLIYVRPLNSRVTICYHANSIIL